MINGILSSAAGVDIITELIERGVALGHTPPMPVRDVAEALRAMNRQYLLDLVARDPNSTATERSTR